MQASRTEQYLLEATKMPYPEGPDSVVSSNEKVQIWEQELQLVVAAILQSTPQALTFFWVVR